MSGNKFKRCCSDPNMRHQNLNTEPSFCCENCHEWQDAPVMVPYTVPFIHDMDVVNMYPWPAPPLPYKDTPRVADTNKRQLQAMRQIKTRPVLNCGPIGDFTWTKLNDISLTMACDYVKMESGEPGSSYESIKQQHLRDIELFAKCISLASSLGTKNEKSS